MTHFRIWYERKGGHMHLAIFAGKASRYTHGKCGDICMTCEEFDDFEALLKCAEIEFVDRAQEREDNSQFGVGA